LALTGCVGFPGSPWKLAAALQRIALTENIMSKMHPSVTPQRVIDACETYLTSTDNPGFCIECGAEASDVDPDARRYECESCGSFAVFGAEELLLSIVN